MSPGRSRYIRPRPELLRALDHYAKSRGRYWRSKLLRDWEQGRSITPELQELRNGFGPAWLVSYGRRALEEARAGVQ